MPNDEQQAKKVCGQAVHDTVSKIVDEYRDMKRRQWNRMIYNAPESESTILL